MKKKFTERIIFLSSITLLIYVIFKSGLIFESALKQHFDIDFYKDNNCNGKGNDNNNDNDNQEANLSDNNIEEF